MLQHKKKIVWFFCLMKNDFDIVALMQWKRSNFCNSINFQIEKKIECNYHNQRGWMLLHLFILK